LRGTEVTTVGLTMQFLPPLVLFFTVLLPTIVQWLLVLQKANHFILRHITSKEDALLKYRYSRQLARGVSALATVSDLFCTTVGFATTLFMIAFISEEIQLTVTIIMTAIAGLMCFFVWLLLGESERTLIRMRARSRFLEIGVPPRVLDQYPSCLPRRILRYPRFSPTMSSTFGEVESEWLCLH
jgi:hypothetical protein